MHHFIADVVVDYTDWVIGMTTDELVAVSETMTVVMEWQQNNF